MFLVLLAGVSDHDPLYRIYFLQADTRNIPNAPDVSRWTFWNVCAESASGHNDCGKVHPAFPLDPPRGNNFNTKDNVPHQFLNTHQYYYLTRFMFAFMLIGLVFAAMSLFTGLLALCTRIGSLLSGLVGLVALFFHTLTASLMTAAYVKGRNNFKSNGQSASFGRYSFGFMWAAVACLFLSSMLFCVAGGRSSDRTTYTTHRSFFGGRRRRSTRSAKSARSRGSFIDGDRKEYL